MSAEPVEQPLCVGKAWLFEATDKETHLEARKVCAVCPVIDWCREQLDVAIAKAKFKEYGPGGTWAGLYVCDGEVVDVETIGADRGPRRRVAECGTPSGYKRHLRLREETCEACRASVRPRKSGARAS